MYRLDSSYIGYPPIQALVAAPANLRALNVSPGFLARAEDSVWGPGEFVFGRANGSIRAYALCVVTRVWDATNKTFTVNFTETPNTANLGRELAVNQGGAMTAGQYGWFLVSGVTPVDCSASVAADTTFGIAAAGQGGANSAGKQVLNARVITAAAQTAVSASVPGVNGVSGGNTIQVQDVRGFIFGGFLSGTGVGASSRVTGIDELSNVLTVSVVNSAAVTGNVTCTYNNATIFYNVAQLNRAFAQGAIT